MKLTRFQTLCLACFVASLLPAYWFANWRHEAQLENLNDMLEKEQALHASADKLMSNCETIAARQTDTYNATHQICNQGNDIHTRTEQTMAALAQDKAANDIKWYRNFGLTSALLNLFAWSLYRINIYLRRDNS